MASVATPDAIQKRSALALIALSQLFALSLWFSASAVAPQLSRVWKLSTGQEAGLTLAVQIGFVVGALLSASLTRAIHRFLPGLCWWNGNGRSKLRMAGASALTASLRRQRDGNVFMNSR